MQGEDIREKIASFPRWHYQIDLKGNLTPVPHERLVKRHQRRKKYFFDPLVGLFGGSLEGKRVLDLGCNAGFWSLCAIEAGCDYVLGIDGLQMHIEQADFVFEVKEVARERYDFILGDIFMTDLHRFGPFDVVLCLGLMYHISKHVELMEKISEVNDDVLAIDTTLSLAHGSFLELRREPMEKFRNAVDRGLVMHPTKQAVRNLVEEFGYSVTALEPVFRNERGELEWMGRSFRAGRRQAFICAKKTDLSRLPAEVEPA
jgi:tRNA (mo5U34)-methyltransferase